MYVGLGSRLKNMVKFKGDALAALAVDPEASEDFVQLLSEKEIWLLGLPERGQLESDDVTDETIGDYMEEGAWELDAVKTMDQFNLYTIELEGHKVIPVFSSQKFIGEFVANLDTEHVTAFHSIRVPSEYLFDDRFAEAHLVLNFNTQAQRHVTVDERLQLKEILAAR